MSLASSKAPSVGGLGILLWLVVCLLPRGLAGQEPPSSKAEPTEISQLRDITGIEKTPANPSSIIGPLLALAVLGPLVLAALLVVRAYRRYPLAAPISPEEWASTELDRLHQLSLPEKGEIERFHTLLSAVVRQYLERQLHLPASRQTTPEFLAGLAQSAMLPHTLQTQLGDFLERCDLAKFARARFSTEECGASERAARQLVDGKPGQDVGENPVNPAAVLRKDP
jgi:hypothetical protein